MTLHACSGDAPVWEMGWRISERAQKEGNSRQALKEDREKAGNK
jgi:hypothetical protein